MDGPLEVSAADGDCDESRVQGCQLAAHLIVNLKVVLQSSLPIEVAYAGDKDLSSQDRERLRRIEPSIKFLDLLDIFPAATSDLFKAGWASKPFALLAASYPRTILVDADAVFLQKPDALFDETPGLSKTGALFFHDRVISTRETKRQKFLLDQLAAVNATTSKYLDRNSFFWQGKSKQEADSGLVAMDKSKANVFMGLVFACWLNTKNTREKVTYRTYHGDKETFWIAMELSKAPYTFPSWYAGQIGALSATSDTGVGETNGSSQMCGRHMLHVDLLRREPFWFNAGLYEEKRRPSHGFANMTHWWVQFRNANTDQDTTAPDWRWQNGGVACIEHKKFRTLDERYRDILARTTEQIAAVGEDGRR